MKRLGLLVLLLAVPLCAADAEFQALVKGIEAECGVKKTSIPLFGLVKHFVGKPAGASHFDMAVFEDLAKPVDLHALVRRHVGGDWQPIVRVWSRSETTFIFAREEHGQIRLILATAEPREAVVMRFNVDGDGLQKLLENPDYSIR